jgi:hypothetical protein
MDSHGDGLNGSDYDMIDYPTSSLPVKGPIVDNYGGLEMLRDSI